MDYQTFSEEGPSTAASDSNPDSAELDLSLMSSVVLARLADEVRNEVPTAADRYDRAHNRHNR